MRETLFGRRRTAEVAIGYFKSEPVGFVLFFHNFRRFSAGRGFTSRICLSMKRFGGAVSAARCCAHVAKLAAERDCGRLEWSVLDWNEPAINFYKKLGAMPMNEWTVFRVTGEKLNQLATRQG